MSYPHYARIGDIWKHIPLCNFIVNEKPRYYIETNSALPVYPLSHSPERDYGIYSIINNVHKSEILYNSVFYQTLLKYNKNTIFSDYLGSPGLAMNILKNDADKYIFCDIENESIDSIEKYALKAGLSEKVQTYKNDSIRTFYSLADSFSSDDFIHIDPYWIFKENNEGKSYFDVCLDAVERGIKTMLWYGFDTNSQRISYHNVMIDKIRQRGGKLGNIVSTELFMSSIKENGILVNPGVVGCGVFIANMSQKSINDLEILSSELINIYENSVYNGQFSGKLIRDTFYL
jgi:23S rRNA (adenine2030-N6)-methyltransferase